MRTCSEYEEMIEAWLDGALGGDQLDELRAHAARCEACGASFAGAARLKGDLGSLAECAERIAAGTPAKMKIQLTAVWRVAAAVLIAVGLIWGAKTWRGNVREGPVQVAEKPSAQDREVIRVADADGIVVSHASHEFAVQFETRRPDVKIVWLYTPVENPAEAAPTTLPSS